MIKVSPNVIEVLEPDFPPMNAFAKDKSNIVK